MKPSCRPRPTFHSLLRLPILATLLFLTGCGTFGSSKVVQQLQNENDRLVAEFRAQRDQNTQLAQRLTETQARLAESEKLLARLSPPSSSRLSRLGSEPGSSLRNSASGVQSPVSAVTKDSSSSVGVGGDESVDFQWRPMRKESK